MVKSRRSISMSLSSFDRTPAVDRIVDSAGFRGAFRETPVPSFCRVVRDRRNANCGRQLRLDRGAVLMRSCINGSAFAIIALQPVAGHCIAIGRFLPVATPGAD